MLDIKFIRENPDIVKKSIKDRNLKIDMDQLLKLDADKRKFLMESEELKAEKNKASKGGRPDSVVIEKMKSISQKISDLDNKVEEIDKNIQDFELNIPNIPHKSIPIGPSDANKVVRSYGKKRKFDFNPKNHIELGETLDILDFPRSSKISGSGFCLFKGLGALLERALINFMLDLHTKEHGYKEIFPPFLVNRASMTGTGQLPKLEEDMYRLKDDDLFLIPTAEVPVTNLHRDEVLEEEELPIYYTAYTACFRREAGSYGKDTKGLMRVHQFDKVELVKFVRPETSYEELEKLLSNAEEVLKRLNLSYRVVMLATGDISFAAAKCYDIEAWAPGIEKNLEVSSCSNFTDFQARRANIKYRPGDRKKLEYVHTLNGSGIAMARTIIAIMENYQEKDGSILIPDVLRPYMGGRERITKE
ncbi:MAG: serine--tRNA ligase [Candidatus Omnitrophica bacterium]|nr:serine--tRNA ligase [Candidatus Omnitrophota bacterium]MBU4149578.1 serine--tRNA ligase [Candidatus Omnitrophota bacterium]